VSVIVAVLLLAGEADADKQRLLAAVTLLCPE
jgi:hypothetical protein